MSRRGNCYDNAVMESVFSTVKSELADRFDSFGEAKMELFDYLEVFYNQPALDAWPDQPGRVRTPRHSSGVAKRSTGSDQCQPMDTRGFQARVGNRRLEAEPKGEYLTVQLDDITTDPPAVTAFVRFGFRHDSPEDRFDFIFMTPPAGSGASECRFRAILRRDSHLDVGTLEVQPQ